jgi:trigger factor
MQVSVESTGKLERRMHVQVPAERVNLEITSRLKELSRTARLNGFRPGKAPLTVIRQQFGPRVHREVIGELMQSSFSEAVNQSRLALAGNPRIEPQSVALGQDLKYVATFEVFPDVAVEVDGAIDGVAFAGGRGDNVAIVIGENRMLPQLEQGLIGAVAGEEKVVDVDFPPDYRATELAGRRAGFKVVVKTVEQPVLPELDEEFCKVLGVTEGGVARLREDVTANMRRELDQTLRNRNKAAVMDKILQANPIDVPNALLDSQIRDMQLEAMRRAGTKDPAQAPPRESLVEPARRRVALGLLFKDIIRRENIVLDPARTTARLEEMVGAYGDAATLKRAYLQNPDAMRQVESLALEGQVVDWVLAHAKVHEKRSSFKEVMNFEG